MNKVLLTKNDFRLKELPTRFNTRKRKKTEYTNAINVDRIVKHVRWIENLFDKFWQQNKQSVKKHRFKSF